MISDYNDLKEPIELFISCRKLHDMDTFSKSDPYAKVWLCQKGEEKLLGKTEAIDNCLNPNFIKTFTFDYYFEVKQEVLVKIYDKDKDDNDDFIGEKRIDVGAIVGAKGRMKIEDLQNNKNKVTGKLILKIDKVVANEQTVYWQWSGAKLLDCDFFTKSDPYIQFFKQREDNDDFQIVYQSEVIDNNLNPTWQPFKFNISKLTSNPDKIPFKIICYDYDGKNSKPDLIGYVLITFDEIFNQQKRTFQLINSTTKKNPGTLSVNFNIPTFIDYIQGGCQLNLSIAIDYTGSNGDPISKSSLHYIDKSGAVQNQYQQVIEKVGAILLNYDYDQYVSVYGFGGNLNFSSYKGVHHCFPINGNFKQPEVYHIKGIMDAYNESFNHVVLQYPTIFGPVIKEAIEGAKKLKKKGSNSYLVLVIITDGQIDDMDETQKLLKKASKYPLSIIIVGVGNANFSNMEELDGDDAPTNSKYRDLVQFVPFLRYKDNSEQLAQVVLEELPQQLIQYMNLIKKTPNKQVDIKMSQVALEF